MKRIERLPITLPSIQRLFVAIIIAGSVLLASCASQGQKSEEETPGGVVLLFSVKEAGTDFYQSRMYVDENVMLTRDSRSKNDYLLFDRKKRTIYSVSSGDETIFVITPKDIVVDSPLELDYRERSQPSAAIPQVQEMQATHYRYDANGEHCYDAVALPEDFLPEVVQAMREFRTVLAGEHASTVGNIPRDMLDACDLSVNIFHATKHLEHGLPIREWDQRGYQRFLVKYKKGAIIEAKDYALPEHYRRYSISDM
jgi:hypothetical protein